MKLVNRFFTLSLFKQLSILIWGAHFFTLFVLIGHHFLSRTFKPSRPLIVRTVVPKTTTYTAPVLEAPIQSHHSLPPSPSPAPSKAKPKPKPKAAIASAKPTLKKQTPPPALKEIAQSLKAITEETKKPKEELFLPPTISPKKEEPPSPITAPQPTYVQYLVEYLQSHLDLPEYGSVRLKLEIDCFGHLINCEILDAKSQKNGDYLKSELPHLSFPYLKDFDIMDTSQEFTITFKNA